MKDWNRRWACGMAVCAAVAATRAIAQTPARTLSQYRIAAMNGQPAPGLEPGFTLGGGSWPVLDNAGRVAFYDIARRGTTTITGLWMETAGGLQLVCRDGQSPADHPEITIRGYP